MSLRDSTSNLSRGAELLPSVLLYASTMSSSRTVFEELPPAQLELASFLMHNSVLAALLATASALQPSNKMWGTAAWNWGSAVGDAHDAAAELRSALSTEDARRDYLIAMRTGRVSEASAKLCFALTHTHCALAGPFNDAYSALVRGEYENDVGFADLATTAAPGVDRYNLNAAS